MGLAYGVHVEAIPNNDVTGGICDYIGFNGATGRADIDGLFREVTGNFRQLMTFRELFEEVTHNVENHWPTPY